ncbi:MAG: hypothetical protein JO264_21025 [Acidisphaera sp.]|nr:hypothetical protein [Acidisphaera sp.]
MHLRTASLTAALLAFTTGSAFAADRNVDIVNNTGQTMIHFYASNTGTNSWEEDILGHDKLASGDTQPIDINDGTGACKFDFKAVFADGSSSVRQNVDVCSISSFTYH